MAWRVGEIVDDRYEVVQVHESGGMGLVYRVRHLGWGTDLAVKSPRPELFRTARDRELFVTEAETWVSLGLHPNVCGCHYVREIDGIPRVFAEYIDGGSLRDHIRDRRLYQGDPDEVRARILDLAVQMARGLQHAHERGLVHQDVKPANVLLDRDGTAKITDFGLARARPAQPGAARTAAGPDASVLVTSGGMTRAYASPEQAMGRQIGRRSDVFSLGASVLEMFVGAVTWYSGPVAGSTLDLYRGGGGPDVAAPMPAGVGGLLERCLSEDPARRPGSMGGELATELALLYERVTGEPYPRPAPAAAELRADELNNRGLSLLDLGRPVEAEQAFSDALAADPRHPQATYNRGLLRWRRGAVTDENLVTDLEALRAGTGDPWPVRHLLSQVHLERGDLDSADALLAGIEQEHPGEPETLAARQVLATGQAPDVRPGSVREINWHPLFNRASRLAVRTNPDGRFAVTGFGSHQGPVRAVRLWDLRKGELLRSLDGLPSWLYSVDLSGNGRHAVSVGPDNDIRFWDFAAGRCLLSFTPPGEARDLYRVQALRLDAGARTAVAVVDGRLWVWDFPSGTLRWRLGDVPARPMDDAHEVELTEDGRLALLTSRERATAELWDLHTGSRRFVLAAGDRVTAAWLHPDGHLAATAATGLTIRLWDLRDGSCLRTVTAPVGESRSISLSDDARYALTGADENSVRLWDLHAGRCLRTFRGHKDRVAAVRMSSNGRTGLSAGEDNTARWWRLAPDAAYRAPLQISRPRRHAELDRLGNEVTALLAEAEQATGRRDHRSALALLNRARAVPGFERAPAVLAAWRELARSTTRVGLRGAWPVHVMAGQDAPHVYSVAISADGRLGVAGSGGGPVRLWDLARGVRLPDLDKHLVGEVGLSADGQRVLSSGGGRIHVWSAATGRTLSQVDTQRPGGRDTGETGSSGAVSYSADGRLALAVCWDNALRLWDLDSGRCTRVLTGHRDRPTAVRLSADGTRAASGGRAGELLLWGPPGSTQPLRLTHPGLGEFGQVGSVCLSADGRYLLSAGQYGSRTRRLHLWDAVTGAHLRAFDDQPDESMTARLSVDGRFAFSGGRDNTVRVWDTGTGRCLRVLEGHSGHVWSVTPTPDTRYLLSGGSDGTMRLWELDWELSADGPP